MSTPPHSHDGLSPQQKRAQLKRLLSERARRPKIAPTAYDDQVLLEKH